MKKSPTMTIQTSERGVDRVVVTYARGEKAGGIALLERLLPALRELDRRVRETGENGR